MRHFVMLLLLSGVPCALVSAEHPTDADILAMAKRRIAANDMGMTFEQTATQRIRNDHIAPAGEPVIVTRGKTVDQRLPVRFQVPVTNSRMVGEGESKSVAIIDAWFWRDEFGTWSMEWRYNVDQSLLAMEGRKGAIEAAAQQDPDLSWRRKLVVSLKSGLFPAQVQFQGGNYEDDDGNGIGDFAKDLEVLNGTRKPRGKPTIDLRLLPKDFVTDLATGGVKYRILSENERGFWMFTVLPSGAATYVISVDGQVRELPGSVLPMTLDEAKAATAKAVIVKR